mmetsp:Transcript_22013/g.63149  ORF Transcript_22013/g.63149 Transcript_22013/m.63149 type:complete len:232 (-) Transcript_22013:567-1262(-)
MAHPDVAVKATLAHLWGARARHKCIAGGVQLFLAHVRLQRSMLRRLELGLQLHLPRLPRPFLVHGQSDHRCLLLLRLLLHFLLLGMLAGKPPDELHDVNLPVLVDIDVLSHRLCGLFAQHGVQSAQHDEELVKGNGAAAIFIPTAKGLHDRRHAGARHLFHDQVTFGVDVPRALLVEVPDLLHRGGVLVRNPLPLLGVDLAVVVGVGFGNHLPGNLFAHACGDLLADEGLA